MSLIGFKARNHEQQTAKRGALDEVDDRGTKWEFIHSLEARFGEPFTLDVAAAAHNAKGLKFYTRADDGLNQPWHGNVWCNPPYSRIKGVSDLGSWVAKAWVEWNCRTCSDTPPCAWGGCWGTHPREEGRPRRITMLLPANRAEQGWWQDHIEPHRDRPGSPLRVEFLRGRMRFDQPAGWALPEKGDRPPFGLCLLIWEDR